MRHLLSWADLAQMRKENGPTVNAADTPLEGPPPPEVPLADSPLVRVIAQVRFPLIASVEKRDFIAPFQEAIRKNCPEHAPWKPLTRWAGHPHRPLPARDFLPDVHHVDRPPIPNWPGKVHPQGHRPNLAVPGT